MIKFRYKISYVAGSSQDSSFSTSGSFKDMNSVITIPLPLFIGVLGGLVVGISGLSILTVYLYNKIKARRLAAKNGGN